MANIKKVDKNFSEYKIGRTVAFLMVDYVADTVFSIADDGYAVYRPQYLDLAIELAIATYCVDDVDINKDDFIEEFFDDVELQKNVGKIIENNTDTISFIKKSALDLIEFNKAEYLKDSNSITEKLIEILDEELETEKLKHELICNQNKLTVQEIDANKYIEELMESYTSEEIKSMNDSLVKNGFDSNRFAERIAELYLEGNQHSKNYEEIIDYKNKKIIELENRIEGKDD